MELVLVGHHRRQVRGVVAHDFDAGAAQAIGKISSAASSTCGASTGCGSRGLCRARARKVLMIRAQRSAAARKRPRDTSTAGSAASSSSMDRPSQHHRQRVVELVRDPGQQRAQGRQLFLLVQRSRVAAVISCFGTLALGDVRPTD